MCTTYGFFAFLMYLDKQKKNVTKRQLVSITCKRGMCSNMLQMRETLNQLDEWNSCNYERTEASALHLTNQIGPRQACDHKKTKPKAVHIAWSTDRRIID